MIPLRDFPFVFVQGKYGRMYNKDFILVTKQLFLYALDSQTFYLFIFLIKKWENVDWKFSTKEQSQRSFIQAFEKKIVKSKPYAVGQWNNMRYDKGELKWNVLNICAVM